MRRAGLDTHKAKIAVAVAEPGRLGEVRFVGEIANRPDAVRFLLEVLPTRDALAHPLWGPAARRMVERAWAEACAVLRHAKGR